jgi:hypothetical protein
VLQAPIPPHSDTMHRLTFHNRSTRPMQLCRLAASQHGLAVEEDVAVLGAGNVATQLVYVHARHVVRDQTTRAMQAIVWLKEVASVPVSTSARSMLLGALGRPGSSNGLTVTIQDRYSEVCWFQRFMFACVYR